MSQQPAQGLVKEIRRWDFVALVLNAIIGAGIFGLPSNVFKEVGSWSLVAYVFCALLIALIILCFAELGGRFQGTGGPYLYAREAFGPVVGFQVGWLMWLARLTAYASLCNLFIDYLGVFWRELQPGNSHTEFYRRVVATVVTAVLTAINFIGVRQSARVINIFTVGKIIPLLLFVVIGAFHVDRATYTFEPLPSYSSFASAVLMLVFAFSGFEVAVIPAGEARDPRKHIPFALIIGLIVVAALYILIQVVAIGTLPGLGDSTRPLADSARQFWGTTGAVVISAGALISMSGTLNSILLAAPRLLYAMAEHGQLPSPLARTHRRFHTPHVAIVVCGVVMLTFTLASSFISALTISTVIRLICYAATCLALPWLRRKPDSPAATFLVPAGPAIAVAALLLCAWLLTSCKWHDVGLVAIAAAAGFVLCLATWLARPARAPTAVD